MYNSYNPRYFFVFLVVSLADSDMVGTERSNLKLEEWHAIVVYSLFWGIRIITALIRFFTYTEEKFLRAPRYKVGSIVIVTIITVLVLFLFNLIFPR